MASLSVRRYGLRNLERGSVMGSVFVDGREWFDRVNGNSYFAARVFVDGVEVARVPFQYGYGSAYECAAAWALQDLGILPDDDKGRRALWYLCDASGFTLYRSIQRVTKREAVAWGKPWESLSTRGVVGRYVAPLHPVAVSA